MVNLPVRCFSLLAFCEMFQKKLEKLESCDSASRAFDIFYILV